MSADEFPTRGYVLLNQGKYDLAVKEFSRYLAQNPNNAELHSLLAFCFIKLKKNKEAEHEAKASIGIDPTNHFAHYLMGTIFLEKSKKKEARLSLNEAIRLAPEEADYHLAIAHLDFKEQKYEQAWQIIEEALSMDPEHVGCLNMKGRLAIKLNKKFDAENAFSAAFAKDPDNAHTHTNQGWAMLEKKNYKQALGHFREALRINPNSDFARSGLIEALKAKYWLYRYFLQFSFWMGNLSVKYRWGLIIGLILVVKFLPILAPFYLAFVFFNWFSEILFNSILRFNRFGKYALNQTELAYSNIFLVLIIGIFASIVGFILQPETIYIHSGVVSLGLLFPLAGTFGKEKTPARNKSIILGVILLLIGLSLLFLSYKYHDLTGLAFNTFLIGTVGYTWLINFIK